MKRSVKPPLISYAGNLHPLQGPGIEAVHPLAHHYGHLQATFSLQV